MANKFTRNITDINDIKKIPLHTNVQNDLLSDSKHVYVRNIDEYHCLTDNIKIVNNLKPDLENGNKVIIPDLQVSLLFDFNNISYVTFFTNTMKKEDFIIEVDKYACYFIDEKEQYNTLVVHKKQQLTDNLIRFELNNDLIELVKNHIGTFIVGKLTDNGRDLGVIYSETFLYENNNVSEIKNIYPQNFNSFEIKCAFYTDSLTESEIVSNFVVRFNDGEEYTVQNGKLSYQTMGSQAPSGYFFIKKNMFDGEEEHRNGNYKFVFKGEIVSEGLVIYEG